MSEEVEIIRERQEWMVVHKPVPLLVHPTRPDGADTLIGRLERQFPGKFFAAANRLDRETSGLVLIAKSRETASSLGKQMMARGMKKKYHAIVWGRPKEPLGIINAPLARICSIRDYPIYVKQGIFAKHEGGQPATTRYQLQQTRYDTKGNPYSLLNLELDTGRLHQIRAHLGHIGLPIVGDKLYGPDDQCYLDYIETGWTPELAKKLILPRQALHASHLFFSWEEEGIHTECSLPHDLVAFWDSLNASPHES
ncbi:MAG: RluA family pseudouridine synthase [Verrucomicrobiota bacterium]